MQNVDLTSDLTIEPHHVSIVETDSNISKTPADIVLQDVVQQTMNQVDKERLLEQVLSWMRKDKQKVIYEQVNFPLQCTVSL